MATTSAAFRHDIIEKARHLGTRSAAAGAVASAAAGRRREATEAGALLRRGPARGGFRVEAALGQPAGGLLRRTRSATGPDAIRLRPFASTAPRLLVIGASTGGPQALNTVVAGIAAVIAQVPVLITQHMPSTFTTILAEHLARASGREAAEALDGEIVRPGRIYVAPGGRHMRLDRDDGQAVIALDEGPMVNFCKPAVDPLFTSAAALFGASVLALVLTGMGSDGRRGARRRRRRRRQRDRAGRGDSVVWGMPGAVAQAGHCSAVLPLDEIAPRLMQLFAGDTDMTSGRVRLPAALPEGALRPRPRRRQAISDREPPAARRTQARPCLHRRHRRQAAGAVAGARIGRRRGDDHE